MSIKIENIEVFGFRGAIRGMRNPMNSWHRSDTTFDEFGNIIKLGYNDANLMSSLKKAGTDHRKYLRMIHVQCDVTAPLYWWKEYDTYKIATVANSCSTMHKIHDKEFTIDMFAHEHLGKEGMKTLEKTIEYLNENRKLFLDSEKQNKTAWYRMIQALPSSYLQKRTIDLNYETILNMLNARSFHKLKEWRDLCDILRTELPYIKDLSDNVTISVDDRDK